MQTALQERLIQSIENAPLKERYSNLKIFSAQDWNALEGGGG